MNDLSELLFDAKDNPLSGANKFNGDVSKWDVSGVTNMPGMFLAAKSFHVDISKWDVSKVTNMESMFAYASSFNGDISKWNVSRVSDMYRMFGDASLFNQRLCDKWETSTAAKNKMFEGSPGKLCIPCPECYRKRSWCWG